MSSIRRTSLRQGPAGPPGVVKSAPTAWTPGSINNGNFVSLAVTVAGALAGYPVLPPAWSVALPDGVWMYGQTKANGTVTVYMVNNSGSTQVIAAGNVYVESLVQ